MMTWKIRYTDKARWDLRNIMEYVSYDLLEPETASHPAAFLTRWCKAPILLDIMVK